MLRAARSAPDTLVSDLIRWAENMSNPPFKDLVTDSVRYWEKRRILYNIVLSSVVVILYTIDDKEKIKHLDSVKVLSTFLLAVVANVLFCAAYIPDLLLQVSDYRNTWKKWRIALFAIGTLFAGIITSFILAPHAFD